MRGALKKGPSREKGDAPSGLARSRSGSPSRYCAMPALPSPAAAGSGASGRRTRPAGQAWLQGSSQRPARARRATSTPPAATVNPTGAPAADSRVAAAGQPAMGSSPGTHPAGAWRCGAPCGATAGCRCGEQPPVASGMRAREARGGSARGNAGGCARQWMRAGLGRCHGARLGAGSETSAWRRAGCPKSRRPPKPCGAPGPHSEILGAAPSRVRQWLQLSATPRRRGAERGGSEGCGGGQAARCGGRASSALGSSTSSSSASASASRLRPDMGRSEGFLSVVRQIRYGQRCVSHEPATCQAKQPAITQHRHQVLILTPASCSPRTPPAPRPGPLRSWTPLWAPAHPARGPRLARHPGGPARRPVPPPPGPAPPAGAG